MARIRNEALDWLVYDEERKLARCERCGAEQGLEPNQFPLSTLKMMEGFLNGHRACRLAVGDTAD